MNKEVIFGIVRHLLTAGGGALAAQGHMTEADVNTGVGAIMALIGLVLSVLAKKK